MLGLSSLTDSVHASALFAPYQHVAEHVTADNLKIQTSVYGQPQALIRNGRSVLPASISSAIWGFASGECGQEVWGGHNADQFAQANVADFNQAGLAYLISTGGQAAMFTCASDEGMRQFVERYQSPMLKGIDFDIEGQQSDQQIEDLVLRARYLQQNFPHLRLSFTLATHAGSDARRASLNRTGELVVRLLKQHQVNSAIINLMVMDYGKASRQVCVVKSLGPAKTKRCDMGKSALQAVQNVASKYDLSYSRLAVTAMIGVNDVLENVFSLRDAQQMLDDARNYGYAGVHYWSLDRDRSCTQARLRQASPICHGLPRLPALSFAQTILPAPSAP